MINADIIYCNVKTGINNSLYTVCCLVMQLASVRCPVRVGKIVYCEMK